MKSVNVLLSSYNGEKYIEEQIISVLNQEAVDIKLTIRDDGSTDKTVDIIERLSKNYPRKIILIKGENIGYRRSFLQLLKDAEKADFFAFCDQDDYWLSDKCKRGIEKLLKENSYAALFATGVLLADEELNVIGKTDSWKMPLTIESYFTRQRLAGCTYIFDNNLRNIVINFVDLDLPDLKMPDHDFIVGSCAFACGHVYLDKEAKIYHRRHSNSVTSGGLGIVNRIKTEYELVFKRLNVQSTMAKLLLEKCQDEISIEKVTFLKKVSNYNKNFASRCKLAVCTQMRTGIFVCDFETKFKILIGKY